MKTRDSFFASLFASTALLVFTAIPGYPQDPSTAGKADNTPASLGTAQAATSSGQKADTEIDGVTAELLSVARTDGDTLTVKFKFSNSSQKDAKVYLTGYSPDNLAEKVYYIDSKNKKKYTVIKDAGGDAVCSKMQSVELKPGESRSGWSKLPAPPAGVTTITVFLPGTPPFESVQLAP